jgi:hypothetical protein
MITKKSIIKGLSSIGCVFGYGLGAATLSGTYSRNISNVLGVDKIGYGLPLSWLQKSSMVYPNSPIQYSLSSENFIADAVFWSLVIGIPILLYKSYKWYKSRK